MWFDYRRLFRLSQDIWYTLMWFYSSTKLSFQKTWACIQGDNLQESVVSFHEVSSGDWIQMIVRLSSQYPLSSEECYKPYKLPFFLLFSVYMHEFACAVRQVDAYFRVNREVRGQLLEVGAFLPLSRSQGLKWVSLNLVISSFLPLSHLTCH